MRNPWLRRWRAAWRSPLSPSNRLNAARTMVFMAAWLFPHSEASLDVASLVAHGAGEPGPLEEAGGRLGLDLADQGLGRFLPDFLGGVARFGAEMMIHQLA